MLVDLCSQNSDDEVEYIQDSLPGYRDFGIGWDKSFGPSPSSICGNSSKRSDNLSLGSLIPFRKCMCGYNLVVGQSELKRNFVKCPQNACTYFRWADQILDPPFYNLAHTRVEWRELSNPVYSFFPRDGMTSLHECIVQGSLGDCWFLSALSVLCENRQLLDTVFKKEDDGVCEFQFCKSGIWESISVDRLVPVFKSGKNKGMEAFARTYKNVSFVPLIEKAYAKMYGNYAALHGGMISEALFDLTGCPTESIQLSATLCIDELWVRLNSFRDNGFLIAAATSEPSEGLVGSHAYSILDLVELHNVQVGRQPRITEFFQSTVSSVDHAQNVRLVQMRNPWGKKEWMGDWSGQSEKWTQKILSQFPLFRTRNQEGKFWMEFSDFKTTFSEIEVAKTHANWIVETRRGILVSLSALLSSPNQARLRIAANKNQWTYISLIQPSVRGSRAAEYADAHMVLFNAKRGTVHAVALGEMQRINILETMLCANEEYDLLLFSCKDPTKDSVIRIFSSGPINVSNIYGDPISACMFERLIVETLPVKEVIDISPKCFLQIHSNNSLAGFALTTFENCPIEVHLRMHIHNSNLQCFGKWTAILTSGATTLLGLVVGQPITAYSFEIDAKLSENLAYNHLSTVKFRPHFP